MPAWSLSRTAGEDAAEPAEGPVCAVREGLPMAFILLVPALLEGNAPFGACFICSRWSIYLSCNITAHVTSELQGTEQLYPCVAADTETCGCFQQQGETPS